MIAKLSLNFLLTLGPTLIVTCQSGCNTPIADIGRPLQLYCGILCFETNNFTWFEENETLATDYGSSYLVTNSATFSEIAGHNYSCLCGENNNKQCFTVWVRPVVSITFSNNPVLIGSSVNVSCRAVSYPPANPEDYVLQHPDGLTVVHTHIAPCVDGIIYEIDKVADEDAGEYDCHVYVGSISSETRANLTVYYDFSVGPTPSATSPTPPAICPTPHGISPTPPETNSSASANINRNVMMEIASITALTMQVNYKPYQAICVLGMALIAHTLSVFPPMLTTMEGDSEESFFCRENNGTYAADIVWMDPDNNLYSPGSMNEGGNTRIEVEGSRLSIHDIIRTDEGKYSCHRRSNNSEFAEGILNVTAYPQILNEMILQEIFIGNTSLIASEVDRGRPIASIHWLRVTYDNESEVNISEITPTDFPRFTIVEDGLRISNTQMSDEGIYRIFMHNILRTIYLDILAAFEAPPQPPLKYYNLTIEKLNQPVILNCSVSAVPRPEFLWIQADTNESLPESSFSSTIYIFNKTIISTLNYTLKMSDLNDYSSIHIMCIATNNYGTSEQHFTLSLNSSKLPVSLPTLSITPTPSITISTTNNGNEGDGNKGVIVAVSISVGTVIVIVSIIIVVIVIMFYCGYYFLRSREGRKEPTDKSFNLNDITKKITSA